MTPQGWDLGKSQAAVAVTENFGRDSRVSKRIFLSWKRQERLYCYTQADDGDCSGIWVRCGKKESFSFEIALFCVSEDSLGCIWSCLSSFQNQGQFLCIFWPALAFRTLPLSSLYPPASRASVCLKRRADSPVYSSAASSSVFNALTHPTSL